MVALAGVGDRVGGLRLAGPGWPGAVRIRRQVQGVGQQLVLRVIAAREHIAGGVAQQDLVAVGVVFHRADMAFGIGDLEYVAARAKGGQGREIEAKTVAGDESDHEGSCT
jgi:hypothetical protein